MPRWHPHPDAMAISPDAVAPAELEPTPIATGGAAGQEGGCHHRWATTASNRSGDSGSNCPVCGMGGLTRAAVTDIVRSLSGEDGAALMVDWTEAERAGL